MTISTSLLASSCFAEMNEKIRGFIRQRSEDLGVSLCSHIHKTTTYLFQDPLTKETNTIALESLELISDLFYFVSKELYTNPIHNKIITELSYLLYSLKDHYSMEDYLNYHLFENILEYMSTLSTCAINDLSFSIKTLLNFLVATYKIAYLEEYPDLTPPILDTILINHIHKIVENSEFTHFLKMVILLQISLRKYTYVDYFPKKVSNLLKEKLFPILPNTFSHLYASMANLDSNLKLEMYHKLLTFIVFISTRLEKSRETSEFIFSLIPIFCEICDDLSQDKNLSEEQKISIDSLLQKLQEISENRQKKRPSIEELNTRRMAIRLQYPPIDLSRLPCIHKINSSLIENEKVELIVNFYLSTATISIPFFASKNQSIATVVKESLFHLDMSFKIIERANFSRIAELFTIGKRNLNEKIREISLDQSIVSLEAPSPISLYLFPLNGQKSLIALINFLQNFDGEEPENLCLFLQELIKTITFEIKDLEKIRVLFPLDPHTKNSPLSKLLLMQIAKAFSTIEKNRPLPSFIRKTLSFFCHLLYSINSLYPDEEILQSRILENLWEYLVALDAFNYSDSQLQPLIQFIATIYARNSFFQMIQTRKEFLPSILEISSIKCIDESLDLHKDPTFSGLIDGYSLYIFVLCMQKFSEKQLRMIENEFFSLLKKHIQFLKENPNNPHLQIPSISLITKILHLIFIQKKFMDGRNKDFLREILFSLNPLYEKFKSDLPSYRYFSETLSIKKEFEILMKSIGE